MKNPIYLAICFSECIPHAFITAFRINSLLSIQLTLEAKTMNPLKAVAKFTYLFLEELAHVIKRELESILKKVKK